MILQAPGLFSLGETPGLIFPQALRPSLLLGGDLVDPQMHASTEITDDPTKPARSLSRDGG